MLSLKSFVQSFKKWAEKIDKRLRLVISTVILTLSMLFTTFFSLDAAIIFIPLLGIICYILTFFCILEDIEHIGWFGFFFMPIALTISLYLEYFLFPGRWLTRISFVGIYGISIYAILLTSNIFNVGVEKSLQLYRAAFSVNYFYQAFVAFLSMNFLFSLQQNAFINALGVGIISFLLAFQLFWSIRLKRFIEPEVLKYAMFAAYILAQSALVVSFVPLKSAVLSLFITSSYYSLIGLIYHYIDQRLFKETFREFIFVWLFVLGITLLSLNWSK